MNKAQLIELPEVIDQRGSLSFIESLQHIPFQIEHVYWTFGINSGNYCNSLFKGKSGIIIALSGSVDVLLDDGIESQTFGLDSPRKAFYTSKMAARLNNFSSDFTGLFIKARSSEDALCLRVPLENKKFTVSDCSLIKLPLLKSDQQDVISVGEKDIPFSIQRIFYIYNIPLNQRRGMHAHKYCHEVLVAANGSFDVELDDGETKRTVSLDDPAFGLHIPPGIWATEQNYSKRAICLVLASDKYDQKGYINTYSEFINYRLNGY